MTTPPVAMTIAGSDSGGGAGLQADLRMFGALGVHGCVAVTALTAQSTTEVRDVLATPAAMVRAQIETVLDDLPVRAAKTGMLATADNVRVVTDIAATGRLGRLVVDPVMVSSSGHRLLDADAEAAYLDLFAHAVIITPNQREAAALLGRPIASRAEQRAAELLRGLLDPHQQVGQPRAGDRGRAGGRHRRGFAEGRRAGDPPLRYRRAGI